MVILELKGQKEKAQARLIGYRGMIVTNMCMPEEEEEEEEEQEEQPRLKLAEEAFQEGVEDMVLQEGFLRQRHRSQMLLRLMALTVQQPLVLPELEVMVYYLFLHRWRSMFHEQRKVLQRTARRNTQFRLILTVGRSHHQNIQRLRHWAAPCPIVSLNQQRKDVLL